MENKIKKIIENTLRKLSVDFDEIVIHNEGETNFRFAIKSNDSGILIGAEGNNIKALNHIIKQIIWRSDAEEVKNINFFVDINDYQQKNIERVKNKAKEVAEKSIVFKRDIEMEPMSSFERMIVHSALSDNPQIETESSGEGVFRKVNIKFKN